MARDISSAIRTEKPPSEIAMLKVEAKKSEKRVAAAAPFMSEEGNRRGLWPRIHLLRIGE